MVVQRSALDAEEDLFCLSERKIGSTAIVTADEVYGEIKAY